MKGRRARRPVGIVRKACWATALSAASCLALGCHNQFEKPLHYIGDACLDHYVDEAGKLAYPDLDCEVSHGVEFGEGPRRIREPGTAQVRDLSLAEAIFIALQNNEIIRTSDEFGSRFNALLNNPDAKPSQYDPGIQETGFLFGRRGIEAALSDFDAQWTTSMIWGRNEQVLNTPLFGLSAGTTQKDETAQFSTQLQKVIPDSSLITLTHNWDYTLNNLTSRLFGSNYDGVTEIEFRRPLWAGAGVEYTRIAGSIGRSLQNVSTVGEGVVIARINNDITLADFELAVTNLLLDVENLYWDLSLAYRSYHAELVARNSALEAWRKVKSLRVQGLEGGSAADESQARENYFSSRARVENALADINARETRLRRLIGLPVNDGQVLRPVDEPTTARFLPDWHAGLAEALTRRVELRRQKWNIKSLELQLRAANSLTRPRLDFVSRYRVNAFGDTLWRDDDNDGVTTKGYKSGYGSLFQGDETGWDLGFQMSMPFGFRRAYAQVRNYELRLTKARAALGAMELDISHELSNAFQNLDRAYATAQSNFNARRAAEERVSATLADYKAGRATLDLLLRSQVSLAAAEIAYFQSVVNYNKAIAEIHYRKGTLLDLNHVCLQEGLWEAEAYEQALRRAWKRSYAFDSKALHAEPEEFVNDCLPGWCEPWMTGESVSEPGQSPPPSTEPGGTESYDEPMPPGRDVPPAPSPSGPQASSDSDTIGRVNLRALTPVEFDGTPRFSRPVAEDVRHLSSESATPVDTVKEFEWSDE